jgi:translocation and assembly module TamB
MRTPELLVRSDLELHATTDAAGVTRLTGNAKLRDSLVLANFNSLLPSGPRGVTREPPYFAVQAEPFRHWPLDIQVRGQEAIKIRTTVYNGTASARFHLTGTLGEPRAVGDVSADQGQVLFPFAVFRVQQGSVRLSEADSFHAKINLVATSQRRDYQLRLEVTGQLPNPIITMSSTPALEATDVLLMVMTGRPPTGDTATSSAQRMALLGAYLGRGIFEDLGASGENRLEISSGEQITNEGRETYEIEYKLGERWSLVGEYDQFDSYNADLKRRIYIQESTPREKK